MWCSSGILIMAADESWRSRSISDKEHGNEPLSVLGVCPKWLNRQ